MQNIAPNIRYSISDLQKEYDNGNKAPLENLMRAWKGIKELDPQDPRSFFNLGGFHGEPFRGQGMTDPAWWGGYCQHGTVLFPTWHRAYLHQLEKALQSIAGCESVTLPFWDECSDESRLNGIPRALTDEFFTLNGEQIANPLRSFALPVAIEDQVSNDGALYSKPLGYETVRFPLSGLVGTPADQAATAAHNAQFSDYAAAVKLLNINISTWLNFAFEIDGRPRGEIYSKFVACLDAPNYTLFSNTTSMGAWNKANPTNKIMALESPHNFIHLAVGGYDVQNNPNPDNNADSSLIAGANGDMGENDTAALDPIFFFHHCFIDYTFWIWQRRNGFQTEFTIDSSDPGANYSSGPPPAGANPGDILSLDTPLEPFVLPGSSDYYTSAHCIDIEGQLGYSYGPGSLDSYATRAAPTLLAAVAGAPGRTVRVDGIDRSKIRGSFIIEAYAEVDGELKSLGHEPVLSRWQVGGCANCQTHLKVRADFNLPPASPAQLAALASSAPDSPPVYVSVRTHDGALHHRIGGPPLLGAAKGAVLAEVQPAFTVDIV